MQYKTMSAFRAYLRDYFARPGAPSQGEVARRAGLSRVQLNRIVQGHSVPTLPTAEALAIATGSTLSRILKTSVRKELVAS